MMARWFLLVLVALSTASTGCCCFPGNCGPCGHGGGACCLCLPRPIIWNGCCNECEPGPCESCGDCYNECGLFPLLRRGLTCGKGCGEVYMGEWVSDPPDCCDPCDQCGNWTGQQGYCCLGPFQRLLAALHGYRYCPRPNCGPWAPLCNKSCCGGVSGCACGPVCGCDHCGGGGCTSCGASAHGATINYEGASGSQKSGGPHVQPHSILEENWDVPKTKVEPGKPIHKAQQPPRSHTTRMVPPGRTPPRVVGSLSGVRGGTSSGQY